MSGARVKMPMLQRQGEAGSDPHWAKWGACNLGECLVAQVLGLKFEGTLFHLLFLNLMSASCEFHDVDTGTDPKWVHIYSQVAASQQVSGCT